jgi:site-specific recombinase XerD
MSTSLGLIAGLLTSYRCDIQTLDWGALRYQHTAAVRALLADLYAPATANKMLAALRGVLKEAWRLGQMSAEEHARASDLAGVRGHTVPAGRELTAGEIAALLSACERDISPAGLRDGAIIATMYAAGLRREEIVALDLGDYNADTGRLVVRGKGNKERTAYLEGGAALAIADWLNVRRSAAVAGEATRAVDTVGSVHSHATGTEVLGALFWPVNKGGKLVKRRLTTQAIYNILHKRAMEAGIKEFSPHDLRRTFVSDLLDAGADIATVAKMAGHSNVQTTARYDRRPEEAKRRAARLLHVPYHHRDRKGKED